MVYCYDKYDVSNAICFARGKKIGFRIRSGGHNYEGYSSGNAIIIIDISRMNKVRVVEDWSIVKIQGGVDNKKLYEFVSSRGYPFPGGSCPTVRVAGYSLGGGWGYSTRYLGLGCDSIIQIEIVDYTGKLIIANEHCNSDLFWA
ncbi:MAG: FAD-binding oxidoreductase, partial [Clostridium sp.]